MSLERHTLSRRLLKGGSASLLAALTGSNCLSLERHILSRRLLKGGSPNLLAALCSSGSTFSSCSEQVLLELWQPSGWACWEDTSEVSWTEESHGVSLEKSWRDSSSSGSRSLETQRSTGSSTSSEEPGVVSSHDETHSKSMTFLELDGKSVRLRPEYEVVSRSEESTEKEAVPQWAVLSGPYNSGFLDELQEVFEKGKVEYWGGRVWITMGSSPISELDPATDELSCWQRRKPRQKAPLKTFGSSATFDVVGSTDTAGQRARFIPDVSITTEARFLKDFAVLRYKTKILRDYFSETVIEIRSEGNPPGSLEKKAYLMLASGADEVVIVDGYEGKVTQIWPPKASENLVTLQQEFLKTSCTISITTFQDHLSDSEMPQGVDRSREVVTMIDTNPGLLLSRCWDGLRYDIGRLKYDALYWQPTAKLVECSGTGLETEQVGTDIKLKPRTTGGPGEMHKLLRDAPDPEYTLDDIAWAAKISEPKSMAGHLISGVRKGDLTQMWEGIVHLPSLNEFNNDGELPLVVAVKLGNVAAVELLVSEGAGAKSADASGMTALVAAWTLKRDDFLQTMNAHAPSEPEAVKILATSADVDLLKAFLQGHHP